MPILRPYPGEEQNLSKAVLLSGEACQSKLEFNCPVQPIQDIEAGRISDYWATVFGDINVGNLTVDNTNVENLLSQVLAELQNDFEIGFVETPYCTPAGVPIYLCKQGAEDDGSITWDFYTVPDTGDPQVYTGARELKSEGFTVDAC